MNNISMGSFQTILTLEKLCPNLEELCVAYGDLSDMGNDNSSQHNDNSDDTSDVPAIKGFQYLKLLDCSSCNLTNWSNQVRMLRKLPRLEALILDDNLIPAIDITKEAAETEFTSLMNLQIAGSAVTTWDGIESIANFHNLKSLRFRKSPLTDTIGTGEARAGTIARVPQIQSLNASQISDKERLEAERRYVSVASRELLKITSAASSESGEVGSEERNLLFKKYPQFEELMVKHKETMIAAQSMSSGSAAISNTTINVTIRSMSVESCTSEPLQKRLPSNMKIQRLKMMCARAFGLEIELQILHFRMEGDGFPTELDDDENTIGYYGVNDGAEILMNEMDLNAIRSDNQNKAKMLQKRIDQQEQASNVLQAMQRKDIHAHLTATEKASNNLTK